MSASLFEAKNRVLIVGPDEQTASRVRVILSQQGFRASVTSQSVFNSGHFSQEEFVGVLWCARRVRADSFPQLQLLRGHVWGAPLVDCNTGTLSGLNTFGGIIIAPFDCSGIVVVALDVFHDAASEVPG
jgi:hypothetical protein